MKIQLKGIVRTVTPVLTISGSSGKTTTKQSLIITVPGYTDSFGEKKSRDENWEIELFNDGITKHKLLERNLQGKKVIVDGFLNSRTYTNGEEKFAIQLRLADIKEYQPS